MMTYGRLRCGLVVALAVLVVSGPTLAQQPGTTESVGQDDATVFIKMGFLTGNEVRTLLFGVKYFCRSTSTILAGSDGCSFDDAPFAGRCCGF